MNPQQACIFCKSGRLSALHTKTQLSPHLLPLPQSFFFSRMYFRPMVCFQKIPLTLTLCKSGPLSAPHTKTQLSPHSILHCWVISELLMLTPAKINLCYVSDSAALTNSLTSPHEWSLFSKYAPCWLGLHSKSHPLIVNFTTHFWKVTVILFTDCKFHSTHLNSFFLIYVSATEWLILIFFCSLRLVPLVQLVLTWLSTFILSTHSNPVQLSKIIAMFVYTDSPEAVLFLTPLL